MRVLYLVGGNDDKYGAQKLAATFISLMKEKYDVDYCVITAQKGELNDYCNKIDVENYVSCFKYSTYLPLTNPVLNFGKHLIKDCMITLDDMRAINQITRNLDLKKFDIIHTNMNRDLIGGFLSHKYNIPHIWHLQEMYDSHFGLRPIHNTQLSWMNNHCDNFVAISNTVAKDWIKHGIDKDKTVVIYNGILLNLYGEQRNYKEDGKLKIIMAGLIYKEKGQEQLINAISLLPKYIKKYISVDLYGNVKDEYYQHLIQIIDDQGLQDNINFKGYTDKLPKILSNYDVGINCSKSEGFGLSTLEFMASGLCVLVSDGGANTELIKDNYNGLVFQYGKLETLARCIEKIFLDRKLQHKLRVNAKMSAEQYSSDKCIRQLYCLYNSVLEIKRKRNE